MKSSEYLPITVYTPASSATNLLHLLAMMLRDAWSSRGLAWRLTVRDIQAQYRQAFLGVLWAFILPLANTITWIFLSSSGVVSVASTDLPYPVYVFTGTMLWAIFMDALNAPLQQSTAAKPMLAKLNFPREALILSGIYQALFNGGIKIIILLVTLIALGVNPGLQVLLVPIGFLSLVLVGTALGLMVTPIGLLYSDIGRALPLLLQFLMYLSPVVFPMPEQGMAATIYELNPLSPIILTARDWITGQTPDYLQYFSLVNGVTIIVLFAFWGIYRLAMPILIERMSA